MSEEQVDVTAPMSETGSTPDVIEETTLRPLLLHSLSDMREIWLPLLDLAGVTSVTEVGTESGVTTRLLVDRLRRHDHGRLVVLDPDPGVVPSSEEGLEVEIVRGFSPDALHGLSRTDAYLLDGDHNYWTVVHELEAIEKTADGALFPLILMNDVSWPWARRDLYYDPDRIPAEARHPYSFELGVTVGRAEATRGGFRGEGAFAVALTEGGPRNGVLTAVEDFVSRRPHLTFRRVASVFGLGILFDDRADWATSATAHLAPFAESTFLERLERNRVELYLRVIEMQDAPGIDLRARQREWARLDEERSELAVRELALAEKEAEAERAVAAAEARVREAEQRAAATQAPSRRPFRLPGRAS